MDMTIPHSFQDDAVGLDHFCHELLEGRSVTPAQLGEGFRRIPQQQVDLRRAPIGRIKGHEYVARPVAAALLGLAGTAPFDAATDLAEGEVDEFAHRMGLAGGEDVVIGLLLLEDLPHSLDIVARMTPVPLGVEVAEIEPLLVAAL